MEKLVNPCSKAESNRLPGLWRENLSAHQADDFLISPPSCLALLPPDFVMIYLSLRNSITDCERLANGISQTQIYSREPSYLKGVNGRSTVKSYVIVCFRSRKKLHDLNINRCVYHLLSWHFGHENERKIFIYLSEFPSINVSQI